MKGLNKLKYEWDSSETGDSKSEIWPIECHSSSVANGNGVLGS